MEILQSLYQQRLNSLADSFFNLLEQLQKTITPFSQPQLTRHRIDYLKHIISQTLSNDRQRFISGLFVEIEDLKGKISQLTSSYSSHNLMNSKQLSRNSTCSRSSNEFQQPLEEKDQINTFEKSKIRRNKAQISLEQSYFQNQIMCKSNVTSVSATHKTKNESSKSQTSINFENYSKPKNGQNKKQQVFDFKYLRIEKC